MQSQPGEAVCEGGSGGADPQAEQGWGAQAGREGPEAWGLVLARAPAPSPARPSLLGLHPCQSVRESSSSICPAPRDEGGGLRVPPSVTAAGTDVPQSGWAGEGGQAGPGSVCRQQSRNEGTWALHGRGRVTTPGTPGWSRAGTVPLSHCPLLGTATSSPAPGPLTIPAAAAPGSASGKSSCQIRRC